MVPNYYYYRSKNPDMEAYVSIDGPFSHQTTNLFSQFDELSFVGAPESLVFFSSSSSFLIRPRRLSVYGLFSRRFCCQEVPAFRLSRSNTSQSIDCVLGEPASPSRSLIALQAKPCQKQHESHCAGSRCPPFPLQ